MSLVDGLYYKVETSCSPALLLDWRERDLKGFEPVDCQRAISVCRSWRGSLDEREPGVAQEEVASPSDVNLIVDWEVGEESIRADSAGIGLIRGGDRSLPALNVANNQAVWAEFEESQRTQF